MAWFLFIDESGQDHKESPYEVLAGIAIQDRDLWPLISELHAAEYRHFGRRYSAGLRELKAKKILKTKTFYLASLSCPVVQEEITALAKESLDDGARNNSARHLKALALAKLAYTTEVLEICQNHACRVFASIVEPDAPKTSLAGLRKDYAFLFERFFYFLEDRGVSHGIEQQGILVFDELEKTKSHILIDQAHTYFKETQTGRTRARLVIPEPFFVHSELTTGVQMSDMAAYCISWGFRLPAMRKAVRPELAPYAAQIAKMRYKTTRDRQGVPDFEIRSFVHLTDLRTNLERLEEE